MIYNTWGCWRWWNFIVLPPSYVECTRLSRLHFGKKNCQSVAGPAHPCCHRSSTPWWSTAVDSRGWQIFFYDDGERVHAYTLHAHNLFDGKGCMHAPSCHHHVSRISTGEEVHAHPFSQYAFCIMAAVSRCWWWRGGIYMHPRPAFFSSFFIFIILASAKTSNLASRVKG